MRRNRINLNISTRTGIAAIFGVKKVKKGTLGKIFGHNEMKKAKIEVI